MCRRRACSPAADSACSTWRGAIRDDRPHVATGRFGYHVLDTLLAIEEAAEARSFRTVDSTVDQVGSLSAEFDPHAATL